MKIITLKTTSDRLKIYELIPGNVYRDSDGDYVLAVYPPYFSSEHGDQAGAICLKDGTTYWSVQGCEEIFTPVEGAFVEGYKP